MNSKTQLLKGFRDFLPEQMRVRNYVLSVMKEVFESFGFEPLETPSLEYKQTLLGKYGQETDRLVYTFKDKGNRDVGLIYDLTVPVSRVLASYRNRIKLPFKRYQVQKVWREDRPQKGRYREFTQCDFDIFGVISPLADAEIIAIIFEVLRRLKLEKFVIRINSRQVLFTILEKLGIKEVKQQQAILQSIDKLDKKSVETVREELIQKGFTDGLVESVFKELKRAVPDQNLQLMLELVESFGVPKEFFRFDPTLARGLAYYTGIIFETIMKEPKIGSVTGGGRYDKLISQLGGPDIPATGTTIGLDRICDVISELKLFKERRKTTTQVLVTVFNESLINESLKNFRLLKEKCLNVEIYLDLGSSLKKQLKYADKKGIPFAIILGPKEMKDKMVIIKIMKTGEQIKVKDRELLKILKEKIKQWPVKN